MTASETTAAPHAGAGVRTMRAAVIAGPRELALRDVGAPAPGPGEVRIRLEGCGVCGSNLPVWEGRPWFEYPMPAGAPGHEGWGTVDAIGPGVERAAAAGPGTESAAAAGQGIASAAAAGPGTDSPADLGIGDRVAALSYRAYAEYDVAAADAVVRLPERLAGQPFPGEPLGCAVNVFRRSDIRAGQTVVIIGIGFLGAVLTRLASHAGARVVAVSRRAFALETARELGADVVMPLEHHERIVAEVRRLTGGEGADCAIECVGQQWPLDLAGELTRVRGRLVVAGYHQDGSRQVNMQLWNWRGLDVINAHERDPRVYLDGIRGAVDAVAGGVLDPSRLYTHRFTLDRLDEALETLRVRPDGFLKALVMM